MTENLDLNSPDDFYNLSEDEHNIITTWIRKNLRPRKTVNRRHTSYGLKHIFENDKMSGGFYLTNGQFKGAMLECGFEPYQKDTLNWEFSISEKSPALVRQPKRNI